MDVYNITNLATESVSADVTLPDNLKITKEEAQQKTDAELLQMIQQAQGHTGKDFSDYMNCDFSYTYLTGLIRDRGYENGWHKTSEGSSPILKPTVIRMKKSEDGTTRKSFIIEEAVAEEWKSFNRNVPFPSVTLGCALRRFMEDYNSGRIKFELEI
ncbi:hypothetical protein [Oribacterium sp. NK2B42]|uniref:hypothetical protein n=1 Tax=Oribacterium sp. NK2B42 TaxID=689781 RepID=UPI00040EE62D|nr:hypothetical protein [Oribacterium sp. NK2B42]